MLKESKRLEKMWNVYPLRKKNSQILVKKLGISSLLSALLINRGVSNYNEVKSFLKCDLNELHNPYLLKDMDKAIKRINKAVTNKEKIMIFGDYDVDGITSTTIITKTIELIGGKTEFYFPNRLKEGYGLNKKAIDDAKRKNISLIITVDCGTGSNEEISYAKRKDIDVIIIDHHEPSHLISEAIANINPKQKECMYPYKKLAAVGVTFKLAQALINKYNINFDIFNFLDMACLGTVADMVPLDGENRILVKNGLKYLVKTKNIGLKALIRVSGLNEKEISTGDISFRLGPRINASGRLDSADKVIRLFQTNSENEAENIAHILDEQNTIRQNIQEEILNKALLKIKKEINLNKEICIVLGDKSWHKGVIGIVASKIVEIYHRPTILISLNKEGIGYGSGRSILNFHLFEAINSCNKLFIKYGGHNQAVGIKINQGNIKKLRKNINKYAKDKLTLKDLTPSIKIDAELVLSQVDKNLIEEINKLLPFGLGNPKPTFCSLSLSLENEPIILKDKHIKIELSDKFKTIKAVGFDKSYFYNEIMINSNQIHVAYSPELNEWNGNQTIELNLKDMKFGKKAPKSLSI